MILNNEKINEVFTLLSKSRPSPTIELNYSNPYTLAIAVILSAQATDKGVNKITPHLFSLADSPEKMIQLGISVLKECIKSIGLYNNKATHIINMSYILIEKFSSQIPDNFNDLTSLPGIGRKSANVILHCIYHQPTIAVDTHVFRVSNRVGLCNAKNVIETEKQLLANTPERWQNIAHHSLVLHGRYICKARKPDCNICVLNNICMYYNNFT